MVKWPRHAASPEVPSGAGGMTLGASMTPASSSVSAPGAVTANSIATRTRTYWVFTWATATSRTTDAESFA